MPMLYLLVAARLPPFTLLIATAALDGFPTVKPRVERSGGHSGNHERDKAIGH